MLIEDALPEFYLPQPSGTPNDVGMLAPAPVLADRFRAGRRRILRRVANAVPAAS